MKRTRILWSHLVFGILLFTAGAFGLRGETPTPIGYKTPRPSPTPSMIGTADPDQDGLTNTQELAYGTDTNQWDSDGDGYSDGEEISFGSDPLDSESLASYPGLFRLFGYKLPADNDVTEDIALGDVDGDGDQDIVCANAASRNRLYLNRGGGEFVDATVTNLPPVYDFSRGVALGDIDNDGDLDMAVANGGY